MQSNSRDTQQIMERPFNLIIDGHTAPMRYENITDMDLTEPLNCKEPTHHISVDDDVKNATFYDHCLTGKTDSAVYSHSDQPLFSHLNGKNMEEPEVDGETSILDIIQDVVIGLSDGLTVPFALAAGLAALDNSKLVVLAGLAEICAGAISMGLGGYLSGLSEQEYFDNQRDARALEIKADPAHHWSEIYNVFKPFGISRKAAQPLIEELSMDGTTFLDFVMKFDLGLDKPSKWRAFTSALTIGSSYFCAGLIPLAPYMFFSSAKFALRISIGVTITALFFFGLFKAIALSSKQPLYSAIQMVFIGGLAALSAYTVASLMPIV
ncbi:hypothetical protein BDV3_000480 [Batrachochytrium dendrobatidis]|uniref:TIGR00267 family protein n=1 Tax=Batrachochytrium dendrobatidis (strain JEL423) TaxID=403673 RepID=A0A177WD33_BATDL|nr:hypothetical protein BDEG_21514 [Batrachochytrium dendrobatidis JEL423]